MTVVSFDVSERHEFANGETFSGYGPYERIEGKVHFSVDANAAINSSIVDLQYAADDHGIVKFSADFSLVTPKQSSNGSRKMLVDIPNRGSRLSAVTLQKVLALTDQDRFRPGDGFLCLRGFSYLSIGWQWDAQGDAALKLDAPIAKDNGKDFKGQVLMKLQPTADRRYLPLVALGQESPPYDVIDVESSLHQLYVKDHENSARKQIARDQWQFGKVVKGELVLSNQHIALQGGFKRGLIYELCYQTKIAPVVGAGLLAIRDVASALKFDGPASLVKGGFDQVYAFGVSQTGRVLRQMLYHGLNVDEKSRKVYDGMWIHIAGAQRGDFNHRFAQPTNITAPSIGQRFPFAAAETKDIYRDQRDGLLSHLAPAHTPRIIISNTSFEYWRGDASLAHIAGDKDIAEHLATRIYHIAGAHHIGGILFRGKQLSKIDATGLEVAMPLNTVATAPINRALFMILDDWVSNDRPPPDSCHPRLDDGTAVSRQSVLADFSGQAGVTLLSPEKLQSVRYQTVKPQDEAGIVQLPVTENQTYPSFVSALGDDLNEVAGIRLPDLRHALGIHSGWNPRAESTGAADQAAMFAGFTLFFSRHKILQRYADETTYVAMINDDISALVTDRFVLEQDRDWLLKLASDRFKAATSS
jgi:hypothetical protein